MMLPCFMFVKGNVKRLGAEEGMYIHLGGEKIIRASELMAIFDISIEKSSKISKQFVTASTTRIKKLKPSAKKMPNRLL